MTKSEVVNAIYQSFEITKANRKDYVLPRATGNLQDHATVLQTEIDNPEITSIHIFVSDEIAPYAKHLQYKEKIARDFAGYNHWFDKFESYLVDEIVKRTGGKIQ